jgi:hypothetical protein
MEKRVAEKWEQKHIRTVTKQREKYLNVPPLHFITLLFPKHIAFVKITVSIYVNVILP